MQITNAYLTHNRPYTKRTKTTAIAVHWVGNPGSTAMANRNYFNQTSLEVSSNYIVGLNGEVICCIPDEEVAWCTNQANSYSVSIETCHPDSTGKFGAQTYDALVELTASLCKKYVLTPEKGGVIRHFDVTGKVCPKWFVPQKNGGTDTADGTNWKTFLQDVTNALKRKNMQQETTNNCANTSEKNNHASAYLVKVTASALNIRSGPSTNYAIRGCIRDNGVYTIVETTGNWGKLKSGAGWICLSYCRKL